MRFFMVIMSHLAMFSPLQEVPVGNGIMGLLARVILPIITSLFNQKGGSVDDNLGVKFKGSETLQRCRGIGGCIKFLK